LSASLLRCTIERGQTKAYLDQIPFPKIVVPGNHDQPLFNLVHRLLWPLHGYQKWITPVLQDEEMTVVGINTARRDTHKSGRVSKSQIDRLRETMCAAPGDHFKVLVAHHPCIPPEHNPAEKTPGPGKALAASARWLRVFPDSDRAFAQGV
jgi:3',5'-cyclic AMP phosphodiesterase CpdA